MSSMKGSESNCGAKDEVIVDLITMEFDFECSMLCVLRRDSVLLDDLISTRAGRLLTPDALSKFNNSDFTVLISQSYLCLEDRYPTLGHWSCATNNNCACAGTVVLSILKQLS